MNDLDQYLNECMVKLYADGSALYASDSHIELMLTLRLKLSTVLEWLNSNKLNLNVNKMKFVIFASRNTTLSQNLKLEINRQQVEQVQAKIYLWLRLDDNLTFDLHVEYLHSMAVTKFGVILKAHDYLDVKTFSFLYRSLVLPHFDYGDLYYSSAKLQFCRNCRIMHTGLCPMQEAGPRQQPSTSCVKMLENSQCEMWTCRISAMRKCLCPHLCNDL